MWQCCCKWVILNYVTVYRLSATQRRADTYLIVSILFYLECTVGSRQINNCRIYLFHKKPCFSFLWVIPARIPHTAWRKQWHNAHRTFVARQPLVIYRVLCTYCVFSLITIWWQGGKEQKMCTWSVNVNLRTKHKRLLTFKMYFKQCKKVENMIPSCWRQQNW